MILSSLRERTGQLHDRIERTVDLPSRLRSVESYAQLLALFHGFYAPLEVRLASVSGYAAAGLDWPARKKAPLLGRDLVACGYPPGAIESLPRCADLPSVADLAEALGCLYVLEGATLGGQIVRKEVQRLHGLNADCGCAFFSSYRERVGEKWKEFCGVLTAYSQRNPAVEGTVVSAAAETFIKFDQWIAGGATC